MGRERADQAAAPFHMTPTCNPLAPSRPVALGLLSAPATLTWPCSDQKPRCSCRHSTRGRRAAMVRLAAGLGRGSHASPAAEHSRGQELRSETRMETCKDNAEPAALATQRLLSLQQTPTSAQQHVLACSNRLTSHAPARASMQR